MDDEIPERISADAMDEERREKIAYEYLCRLHEARSWISECLNEELPPTVEFEESIRNGVILAKLSHVFAPDVVSVKKIFDLDQERYKQMGLHFRHTDNIVSWLRAMNSVGFPEVFHPETTDVYDKKNMPKVVFCLHALSLFLYRRGWAPPMRDDYGNVAFTKEEIASVAQNMAEHRILSPNFGKIEEILTKELTTDNAEFQAGIVSINDAIDEGDSQKTLLALLNTKVQIHFVFAGRADAYQKTLSEAKKVSELKPDDVILLNKNQIQDTVDKVNKFDAISQLDKTIETGPAEECVRALQDHALHLPRIRPRTAELYLLEFREMRTQKGSSLDRNEILKGVYVINACIEVNEAVDSRVLESLMSALKNEYVLTNVEDDNAPKYMTRLYQCKQGKLNDQCPFLTMTEIRLEVYIVNSTTQEREQGEVEVVGNIALDKGIEDVNENYVSPAHVSDQYTSNEIEQETGVRHRHVEELESKDEATKPEEVVEIATKQDSWQDGALWLYILVACLIAIAIILLMHYFSNHDE